MFALEIEFHDGISSPETILVRRTSSVVGSSEQAHVVIEGIASSACELRLVRGVGREFRCQPVRRVGQENAPLPFLEGSYRGTAELRLGDVTVRVTALDLDLCLNADEVPDSAALRVLQRSLSQASPLFPAMAVHGPNPVFLSFAADQPLLIGRSRKCGLRLDASDVSSEHARVGTDGDGIWVEDLGSTNGTHVDKQRISGRRYLEKGETIRIGSEFVLSPVNSAQDVAEIGGYDSASSDEQTGADVGYPCVVSMSELVRPNRFVLGNGGELRMGRDPANDIWINAPHVSRQHLSIQWTSPDDIALVDLSSNGTFVWGERLQRDVPTALSEGLTVLDFCSGITAAVCRSSAEENEFLSNGAPKSVQRAETRSFKSEEVDLSAYRGAQGGSKLQNWSDFADSSEREEEKPPSIFERLAQRQGNQVQQAEEPVAAIEESPAEIPAEEPFEDELFEEEHVSSPTSNAPSYTALETRMFSASEFGDSPQDELPAGQQFEHEAEMQELLAPENYEGHDFEPPAGNGILKVVLVGLLSVLLLFCLMMVFGFFSDNYFY